MVPTMICIHHDKDLDGFSSGAIVKHKFPDCTLIGWDYKDPIPWSLIPSSQDIIMIDVTFKIDDLIKLRQKSKSLTIIDHHISFKKEYDEKLGASNFANHGITLIYQDKKAACEIGWEYLFPNESVPGIITLLGEYDTWRQDDKNRWDNIILPFQYFARTIVVSAETFPTEWLSNPTLSIMAGITAGKAILTYQEQHDMLACQRSSFEAPFHGLRAIALNTRAFSSNTMLSVYDPEKHDVMVGFEYTGSVWAISLRSTKPDIDVSVIAKAMGGGGHKAASGFEVKTFKEIFV